MRTVYRIKSVDGTTVAEHIRLDLPTGKRMYWRMPGSGGRTGLLGLSTPDLPLYGSERIPAFEVGQAVVICEGERAAEALWALGFEALATVTGASSTPSEDALSVLLPFDVVLWPDHDRQGHQHMNRIAWDLHRLGGHLPRAIVPERHLADGTAVHFLLTKGFDAADLRPRPDRAAAIVGKLIQAAERWSLHPERPSPALPARQTYTYSRADSSDRIETARMHLLDVVERRLGPPKETKQGTPWWCCPFHTDRSPSFKVDPREPFYICFGCGAKGDVFDFLKAMDGVGFKDVLTELAPPQLGAMPRYWG